MLGVAFSLTAAAQQINPITQAMLDGYEQLLSINPKDYFTLYERASQYYRLSRYDLALNDIKKSIAYTPAKEKDQLVSAYSLATDIYIQLKDYSHALEMVNSGLKLAPTNYPLLYMKGNVCLYLDDLVGAQQQFQAMTRVQSRSQEAIFGLAKVAVLQHNYSLADEYISQAEKLDPANYVTYCRMGDLHLEMDRPQQAAADYISAYCLNSSSERPMSAMINLARRDYDAVANAVDYALTQANNPITLNFLKGNIALNAGKYAEAYEAYRHLMEVGAIDPSTATTLSPTMARICLGMGDLQEADKYANIALSVSAGEQNNYLKALIEEANGNIPSAIIYARNAMQANLSERNVCETASLMLANADSAAALAVVNDALLIHPSSRQLALMRAIIAGKIAAAPPVRHDAQRACAGDADGDYDTMLKALAQQLSGLSLDAQSTIAPILAKADKDAGAAYLAALFYANIDESAKASHYKAKAQDLGYEDAYTLQYSVNPLVSLRDVK